MSITALPRRIGRVAFRCDASLAIGSGHVMRCLTLARALQAEGYECHFLCRAHQGHLLDLIRHQGFEAHALPVQHGYEAAADEHLPAHAAWLGARWQDDASHSSHVVIGLKPEWLIVDHYALDTRWETQLRPHSARLMVIDDLADRPHHADLLLDQNLDREAAHYQTLIPPGCQILSGVRYALLRPEFAALRRHSLQRRQPARLERIAISLGGADPDRLSSRILEILDACETTAGTELILILGAQSVWHAQICQQAARLRHRCSVLMGIHNMGEVLSDCDLVIGAAGSSAWERCCLGLPTLQIALADNQRHTARMLAQSGAALSLELETLASALPAHLALLQAQPELLGKMSQAAQALVDGHGCERVIQAMRACPDNSQGENRS